MSAWALDGFYRLIMLDQKKEPRDSLKLKIIEFSCLSETWSDPFRKSWMLLSLPLRNCDVCSASSSHGAASQPGPGLKLNVRLQSERVGSSLLPAWTCLHMSPGSPCSQTIFPHWACSQRKQFHLLNQTIKGTGVMGNHRRAADECWWMIWQEVSGTCWQVTSCQVLALVLKSN